MMVVMLDGEIIWTRVEVWKLSIGYELNVFYLGVEGMLGVIVELVVKIVLLLKW